MDDAASEATQPATQLMMDPRRLGENASDLEDEDMADIFVILHPASHAACIIASNINDMNPELTVSRNSVPARVRTSGTDPNVNATGTMELAEQGYQSCDLALRLSATLTDPTAGYVFGRSREWADFVIKYPSVDGMKRISNRHFRIWIEKSGVIMLEDTSTNGTWVDGKLLKADQKENKGIYKHTLVTGTQIKVQGIPNDDIKFIVTVPTRHGSIHEDLFYINMNDYFRRLEVARADRLRREAAEAAAAAARAAAEAAQQNGDGNHAAENNTNSGEAPNLFPAMAPEVQNLNDMSRTHTERKLAKIWHGGPKYNKSDMIGKGAFASVYLVTAKYDGTQYAAKEIEKRKFMKNGILDQKVESEMRIMRRITHPNIVQFIEQIDWIDHIYIIMDYIPNGTLSSYIEERNSPLPEEDTKELARQMLDALKYLQIELGVTHRDIKPDNILVQDIPPNLHVKLTDFGLSKLVENDETFLRTFCGTILYCAPEVYPNYTKYSKEAKEAVRDKKAKRYDSSIDLWSLAGVLFWCLSLKPPYPAEGRVEVDDMLKTIMTGALDVRPLQRNGVSQYGIDFIKSMLRTIPKFRATIPMLEAHPWLSSGTDGSSAESSQRSQGRYYAVQSDDTPMSGYDGSDAGDCGPEAVHSQLAECASQLSIYDGESGMYEEDEIDLLRTETVTAARPMEVPSSFQSNSYLEDSELSQSQQVTPRIEQPRLFGEINGSRAKTGNGVSESGVFPNAGLPLPLESVKAASSGSHEDFDQENLPPYDSQAVQSTPFYDVHQSGTSDMASFDSYFNSAGASRQAMASSTTLGPRKPSLTGAESMVGDMAINSPSPAATSAHPSFATGVAGGVSLRRQREPSPEDGEPMAKRHQSYIEQKVYLPATTYWNPKDSTTHHDAYVELTAEDYNKLTKIAHSRGEKFERGQRLWESEIGDKSRAIQAQKLEDLMKQQDATERITLVQHTAVAHVPRAIERADASIAATFESSLAGDTSQYGHLDTNASLAVQDSTELPDIHFEAPRRILAKLISTPDSVIKETITLTELLTTWGRDKRNLIEFPEMYEDRIPRYAMKIAFFQKGVKVGDNVPTNANNEYEFYIATKCKFGICVNSVEIKAYQPFEHHIRTPCKNWAKIKSGDIITVWKSKLRNEEVSFRFDAFWGPGKEGRKSANDKVKILTDLDLVNELDHFCMYEESRRLEIKVDAWRKDGGDAASMAETRVGDAASVITRGNSPSDALQVARDRALQTGVVAQTIRNAFTGPNDSQRSVPTTKDVGRGEAA